MNECASVCMCVKARKILFTLVAPELVKFKIHWPNKRLARPTKYLLARNVFY